MTAHEWPAAVPPHLHRLAAWIRSWCRAEPEVRCAYLGGSIATTRADELSDLDVTVYAPPAAARPLFDRLLDGLAADWLVAYRWVLPLPTWHGGRQVFAGLRPTAADEAGKPVVLDLVLSDLDTGGPVLVDPRRDGTPVVLHDPDGLLDVREHGHAAYRAAADAAIAQLADKFATARWIVEKSIRRAEWPEAYGYYLRFALEPVVLLLRAENTPSRWDFGLRYLDTDLRPADRERVLALLPREPAALGGQAAECLAWQAQLLAGRTGSAVRE